MKETQSTIAQWATAAFGEVKSEAGIVARALQEMAELVKCLTEDPAHPKAAEEAADVVICLTRLGERVGVDLLRASVQGVQGVQSTWDTLCFAAKSNTHLAYALMDVYVSPSRESLIAELDRCVWGLAVVAYRTGTSIQDAIDAKMAINRRRQWRRDGHGHGYHLKSQESTALGTWDDVAMRAQENALT